MSVQNFVIIMTTLQKGFSHRKGAKDAKIFKDEVQDFKSFSKQFALPARIIDFLRGKKFVLSVDSIMYPHRTVFALADWIMLVINDDTITTGIFCGIHGLICCTH